MRISPSAKEVRVSALLWIYFIGFALMSIHYWTRYRLMDGCSKFLIPIFWPIVVVIWIVMSLKGDPPDI